MVCHSGHMGAGLLVDLQTCGESEKQALPDSRINQGCQTRKKPTQKLYPCVPRSVIKGCQKKSCFLVLELLEDLLKSDLLESVHW